MGMKTFWQGTSFCITDDVWHKGPVMHCFNIFIVVSLNKMLKINKIKIKIQIVNDLNRYDEMVFRQRFNRWHMYMVNIATTSIPEIKKRSYLMSSVRLYKKICTVYSTYTLQAPCSRFSLFRGLSSANFIYICIYNGDVIKWKYFPRYWLFVRWINRSPVNSPQRPEPRSFDVFFDLCPNKRLSKQAWGWRFETPSRSLLRHCDYIFRVIPIGRRTVIRWRQYQWNNPESYGEMNNRNPSD